MKKTFLTLITFLFGLSILMAQTTIAFSGYVYEQNTKGIQNHDVYIFADSANNPNWAFGTSVVTNSSGYYSASVTIPSGISKVDFTVFTYDCNRKIQLAKISYPATSYTTDFYICVSSSGCMADFIAYPDSTNPLKFFFTDQSTGSPNSWKWNFGDGNTATSQHPNHTYLKHGTYTVTLATTNSNTNCSSTYSYTLNTNNSTKCTAYFTYNTDPSNYYKINFSATKLGSEYTYNWNFGDSTTGTGLQPDHTYKSNGTYYVCLTVSDTSTNCFDTYCQTIRIGSSGGCVSYFYYINSGLKVEFYADSMYNRQAIFSWNFGDSTTFTGTTPYASHTYSKPGKYYSCLTISINGVNCKQYCTYIDIDTSTNQQQGYLAGYIFTGRGFADDATVYLIKYNAKDSTLTAIDTTVADSGGTYYFSNIPFGAYLVKAALNPGSSLYSKYMPTYLDTSLFWNHATTVTINSINFALMRNINMIAGTNPGGPGFIGGKISKGARSNDGLDNILVILLDENNQAVAYTYSNNGGDFEFNNLPYGTYKLFLEIWEIESKATILTIDPANEKIDNIHFVVNSNYIISTSINTLSDQIQSIGVPYPNPTKDQINLNIEVIHPILLKLEIINQIGQIIDTQDLNLGAGNHLIQLPTNQYSKGLYTLIIKSSDGMQVSNKFLKVD